MSEPSLYYVAITSQEWLNWIETGELRCSSRIHRLNGVDDRAGIYRLIELAPDFSLKADDGLLFARLCVREVPEGQSGESSQTPNARVPLEQVIEFFPLNARGYKLLSGDARRAMVCLGEPHFETVFEDWRSTERARRMHEHGVRFVQSAGFEGKAANQEALARLTPVAPRKPAAFAKIERKRNHAYFGWAIALVNISDHLGKEHWGAIRRAIAPEALMKNLETRAVAGLAIAESADVRKLAWQLRKEVKARLDQDCFPCRDSVIAHWHDRLELADGGGFERDLELQSFGRDLRVVEADEGLDAAVSAAYTIGLVARRETVQQLYYASHAEAFASLAPSAPTAWLGPRVERFVPSTMPDIVDGTAPGPDESAVDRESKAPPSGQAEVPPVQHHGDDAGITRTDGVCAPELTPPSDSVATSGAPPTEPDPTLGEAAAAIPPAAQSTLN